MLQRLSEERFLWAVKISEGFTEVGNVWVNAADFPKKPALLVLPHSSHLLQRMICIALVLTGGLLVKTQCGSHIESWGFRSLWPLSAHHTYDFDQLSHMVNVDVRRGQGRRRCFEQSKIQIWLCHSLAQVLKSRWGGLAGPAYFSSFLPATPCHEPHTQATPDLLAWEGPTLSVSV